MQQASIYHKDNARPNDDDDKNTNNKDNAMSFWMGYKETTAATAAVHENSRVDEIEFNILFILLFITYR